MGHEAALGRGCFESRLARTVLKGSGAEPADGAEIYGNMGCAGERPAFRNIEPRGQAGRSVVPDSAGPVGPRETTGNPILSNCTALVRTVFNLMDRAKRGRVVRFLFWRCRGDFLLCGRNAEAARQ